MRIAHLTDLHLRANLPGTSVLGRRRSRAAPTLVSRALDDARRRGAEVAVLTGDLVDVPSFLLTDQIPDAFDRDHWLSAMAADYQLLRDLLDESGLPYIVLPGNHDAYDQVESIFGARPFVREVGDLRFVSFWDREDTANVPRRQGRQLDLFDEVLVKPGQPQVHLQHFVITPELNTNWPHTYREGETLRQRIVESGQVRLSLSGHYHPGTNLIHDQGAAFATGSSLAESPHCYRLYEVVGGPAGSAAPATMQIVPLIDDPPPRRTVFLDYASCLTTMPVQWCDLEGMRLVDGVAPALRTLPQVDYALVALVDQGWVTQAKTSPHFYDAVLDKCAELLAEAQVALDAVYVGARGVLGQALVQASDELRLDLLRSYLVGRDAPASPTQDATGQAPIALHYDLQRNDRPGSDQLTMFADVPGAIAAILTSG